MWRVWNADEAVTHTRHDPTTMSRHSTAISLAGQQQQCDRMHATSSPHVRIQILIKYLFATYGWRPPGTTAAALATHPQHLIVVLVVASLHSHLANNPPPPIIERHGRPDNCACAGMKGRTAERATPPLPLCSECVRACVCFSQTIVALCWHCRRPAATAGQSAGSENDHRITLIITPYRHYTHVWRLWRPVRRTAAAAAAAHLRTVRPRRHRRPALRRWRATVRMLWTARLLLLLLLMRRWSQRTAGDW